MNLVSQISIKLKLELKKIYLSCSILNLFESNLFRDHLIEFEQTPLESSLPKRYGEEDEHWMNVKLNCLWWTATFSKLAELLLERDNLFHHPLVGSSHEDMRLAREKKTYPSWNKVNLLQLCYKQVFLSKAALLVSFNSSMLHYLQLKACYWGVIITIVIKA